MISKTAERASRWLDRDAEQLIRAYFAKKQAPLSALL